MISVDELDIVTFQSISVESARFLSFKQWILSMTDEQDDERGADYWTWLEYNRQFSDNDRTGLLNTFVAFLRNGTNGAVATGSIVIDDQEMGQRLKLTDAVWIGGVNVHRDFRARGYGRILFEHMNDHIQRTISDNQTVCLFTNNSHAKKIYRECGFRSQGFIRNNSLYAQVENVRPHARERVMIADLIP